MSVDVLQMFSQPRLATMKYADSARACRKISQFLRDTHKTLSCTGDCSFMGVSALEGKKSHCFMDKRFSLWENGALSGSILTTVPIGLAVYLVVGLVKVLNGSCPFWHRSCVSVEALGLFFSAGNLKKIQNLNKALIQPLVKLH